MTALIVIGIILLLLFLLAMLNLKFYIRYEGEEVTLKLGVLCFWKQLVPYTEKVKKQKSASEGKKSQKKRKKSSPVGNKTTQKGYPPAEKDWKETAKTVHDIIRSVLRPTRFVLRNVCITGLRVHAVVGGEEPDETAISFGHWNAAVYGGLAAIRNLIKVDVKKIMIAVDFTSRETEFWADGTIKVRVFVAVISLIRMFWHILVNTLKRREEEQDASVRQTVHA